MLFSPECRSGRRSCCRRWRRWGRSPAASSPSCWMALRTPPPSSPSPSPPGTYTPFPSADQWLGSYFNHSVVDPDPHPAPHVSASNKNPALDPLKITIRLRIRFKGISWIRNRIRIASICRRQAKMYWIHERIWALPFTAGYAFPDRGPMAWILFWSQCCGSWTAPGSTWIRIILITWIQIRIK